MPFLGWLCMYLCLKVHCAHVKRKSSRYEYIHKEICFVCYISCEIIRLSTVNYFYHSNVCVCKNCTVSNIEFQANL